MITLDVETPERASRGKVTLERVRSGEPGTEQPLDLLALKGEVAARSATPFAQFEYVRVTFNGTANVDTDIRHALSPPTPEDVDYLVLGVEQTSAPATVPVIYKDMSAGRRAWGAGYIVLRANVASLTVNLLLTVRPRRVQNA